MSGIVKKQFDEVSRQYDGERRGLIPCFDDFYRMGVRWANLDHIQNRQPAVLDLGAGTGLFSSFLLDRYPDARLTLIDFSEEMLEQAKRRFADANCPNVNYIAADYTKYKFEMKFDAVISSLSIHHLEHPDKKQLFRAVRELLNEGGVFVNADQAASPIPSIDRRYDQYWEEAVRSTGLSDRAIEASMERKKQDRNATLEDQLAWLREAGFAAVDCVYKYNEFTVFVALA